MEPVCFRYHRLDAPDQACPGAEPSSFDHRLFRRDSYHLSNCRLSPGCASADQARRWIKGSLAEPSATCGCKVSYLIETRLVLASCTMDSTAAILASAAAGLIGAGAAW